MLLSSQLNLSVNELSVATAVHLINALHHWVVGFLENQPTGMKEVFSLEPNRFCYA